MYEVEKKTDTIGFIVLKRIFTLIAIG